MTLTKIKPAGLSKPVDLADNEKIRLGTGNDLEIYHDGNDSWIKDPGTRHFNFTAGQYQFLNVGANEFLIKAVADGAVELYHNGSKKFETTTSGVAITGGLTADGTSEFTANVKLDGATAGRDITFLRDSNKLRFQDNTVLSFGDSDDLLVFHNGTIARFVHQVAGSNIEFQSDNYLFRDKDNSDVMIRALHDGTVELYYDGSKKFETTANGATLWGYLNVGSGTSNWGFLANDNTKIGLGDSQDLQILHDGTNSNIYNQTNSLYIRSDDVRITNGSVSEHMAKFFSNGAVELFYDNSKKFETTSDGATFSGSVLFPDNQRIKVGGDASNPDLQIYHDGSNTRIIEGGTGHLYVDTSAFIIRSANGADNVAKFIQNGQCELYHNNSKKIETKSTGAEVTGNLSSSISASIGTTGLQAGNVLSVKGSTSNQINIARAANNGWGLLLTNSQPSSGYHTTTNSSVNQPCAIVNVNNDALHFGTNNNSRWTIDHSGHIYPHLNDALEIGKTTNRVKNVHTDGVTFNGDTSEANKLDDYEEGTFSPSIRPENNSTAAAVTVNEANYTKIGRLVHVVAYFTISSNPSGNTGGATFIVGLPFTNIGAHSAANIHFFHGLGSNVNFISGTVQGNSTEILVRGTSSANQSISNLTYSSYFGTNDALIFSATYQTS